MRKTIPVALSRLPSLDERRRRILALDPSPIQPIPENRDEFYLSIALSSAILHNRIQNVRSLLAADISQKSLHYILNHTQPRHLDDTPLKKALENRNASIAVLLINAGSPLLNISTDLSANLDAMTCFASRLLHPTQGSIHLYESHYKPVAEALFAISKQRSENLLDAFLINFKTLLQPGNEGFLKLSSIHYNAMTVIYEQFLLAYGKSLGLAPEIVQNTLMIDTMICGEPPHNARYHEDWFMGFQRVAKALDASVLQPVTSLCDMEENGNSPQISP